jgi:hypothetical protein
MIGNKQVKLNGRIAYFVLRIYEKYAIRNTQYDLYPIIFDKRQ